MTTVIDISKAAGCSPATVSRVINNSGSVSQRVRQRVERAIREEGYVPKNPPRGMPDKRRAKSEETDTANVVEVILFQRGSLEQIHVGKDGLEVGPMEKIAGQQLFSPALRLSNSFFQHIVDGVLDELRHRNLKAMLQVCHDLTAKPFLTDLNAGKKKGALLIGEPSPDLTEFTRNCKQPLILVDMICDATVDVVTIDNFQGVASVVEYLTSLGHRNIGYVGGVGNPAYHERRVSFTWHMLEAGLPVKNEWISEGTSHIEETTQRMIHLLNKPDRPTALFCCNDWVALGVLRAAQHCGLQVPRDLSIVGFDDVEGATFMTPALTTVHVPTGDLGRRAVEQLLVRLDSRQTKLEYGCQVRVTTQLIIRESAAPPQHE